MTKIKKNFVLTFMAFVFSFAHSYKLLGDYHQEAISIESTLLFTIKFLSIKKSKMGPEIKKILDDWKHDKLYSFEERVFIISANPAMENEYFIELVHTGRIRIGKRSYPLKSKKKFMTFTMHGEENPERGNIIRLGWAIEELGKKFEAKLNKNLDILYKYFEKNSVK